MSVFFKEKRLGLPEVKRPENMRTGTLVDFMLSMTKPVRRETSSSVDGADFVSRRMSQQIQTL